MKPSYLRILLITTLLSESFVGLRAVSATKMEDGSSEQDALNPYSREEAADNGLNPGPSRYVMLGISKTANDGNMKIIVVDTGLWKSARAFAQGLSLNKLQDPEAEQSRENFFTVERRAAAQDLNSGMAMARRETMRCMVGRVYRPCWEV